MGNSATEAGDPTSDEGWPLLYGVDIQVHAFLLLVASALFSNGFDGGFVYNDYETILMNPDTAADGPPLLDLLRHYIFGNSINQASTGSPYGPVVVLTFRLQHWLMGHRHHPGFLHAFNFLIALLNAFLVYYLTRIYVYVAVRGHRLNRTLAQNQSWAALCTSPLHAIPATAALLFLAHPVHVDAVTSITGRGELLLCFFGLSGLFCLHHFLTKGTEASSAASPAARPRTPRAFPLRYVIYSIYCLIASVLSRKVGILFALLYAVHTTVVYWRGLSSRRRAVTVLLIIVGEVGVFLLLYHRALYETGGVAAVHPVRRTESPHLFVPSGLLNWVGYRWIIQMKSAELLFFPTSLCYEYSFNCIPYLGGRDDDRIPYFAVATLLGLGVLAAIFTRAFLYRSMRGVVLLAALLWVLIPYAPYSHLFHQTETLIAERHLYIPSIGAVLLIVFGVAAPELSSGGVSRMLLLLLLGLVPLWGHLSHQQNNAWLSDEHLFSAGVRSCPMSGKAHSHLVGAMYRRLKAVRPEMLALSYRALHLDRELTDPYLFLAINEWESHGRPQEALQLLRKCAQDSFSSNGCRNFHAKIREILYPDMPKYEVALDDASLAARPSERAAYTYQAALLLLKGEKKPCDAAPLFLQAMEAWNVSSLYWISGSGDGMPADVNYCTALQWYGVAVTQCNITDPDTVMPSLEGHVEERNLSANDAVVLARRLVHLMQPCTTNWKTVVAQLPYTHSGFPSRLQGAISLSDHSLLVLRALQSFTTSRSPERGAILFARMSVALHRYCHVAAPLQNDKIHAALAVRYGADVAELQRRYEGEQPRWLAELRTLRKEIKLSIVLDEQQREIFHSFLELARCSPDLAFMAV